MSKILIPHLLPERQFIDIPFNAAKTAEEIVAAIRGYAGDTKFTGPAIIGVSGGIDSTLTETLVAMALGPERCEVVMMPHGLHGREAIAYAEMAIRAFHIPAKNVHTVDIQPMVYAAAKQFGWREDEPFANITLGNIMARQRMVTLTHFASKLVGRIFGTENYTEHLLAYFTPWGDSASHVEVIRDLFKTQVFLLASHLGVPQEIVERKPTADLWVNQTDEGELGVPYQYIDQVLYATIKLGWPEKNIVKAGIPEEVVRAVLKRMHDYDFKNHFPTVL